MAKFSDTLTPNDVEAVAKNRVAQVKRKTTMYWMVGCLIVAAIGLFVKSNPIVSFGLLGVALLAFIWYMNGLRKIQAEESLRLLKQWQDEKKGVPDTASAKAPAPSH